MTFELILVSVLGLMSVCVSYRYYANATFLSSLLKRKSRKLVFIAAFPSVSLRVSPVQSEGCDVSPCPAGRSGGALRPCRQAPTAAQSGRRRAGTSRWWCDAGKERRQAAVGVCFCCQCCRHGITHSVTRGNTADKRRQNA